MQNSSDLALIEMKIRVEKISFEFFTTGSICGPGFILKISGEADGSIELEKSYIQLEKILQFYIQLEKILHST